MKGATPHYGFCGLCTYKSRLGGGVGVGVERISKEFVVQPVLEPPCVGDPGVVLLDAACGFTPVCTTLSAIRAARGSG